ncbi:hypothetical protein DFP73DRAFT_596104 [Morchella snyderi]|nr:hypothetical protein DFP73DRAFT_596104 [Morchella snyderi]
MQALWAIAEEQEKPLLAAFDPSDYHCEACTPLFLLQLLHWYDMRAKCTPRQSRHYLPRIPFQNPHQPDPEPPSFFTPSFLQSSQPPKTSAGRSFQSIKRTLNDLGIFQYRLGLHAMTILRQHFPTSKIRESSYHHTMRPHFRWPERLPECRFTNIDNAKSRLRAVFAALEWIDQVEYTIESEGYMMGLRLEGHGGAFWAWGEGGREKEVRCIMEEMSWLIPEGEEMMSVWSWRAMLADPDSNNSELKSTAAECPNLKDKSYVVGS